MSVSQSIDVRPRPSTLKLLLAFVAIYLIWGSTYLAIRFAVETIPPLVTASVRHLVAGSFLFAYSYRKGFRPTRREIGAGLLIGALYFLIGHGTLHWAEQKVASGLAALLIATEPMLISGIQIGLGRERFNVWTLGGLVTGIVGVAILMGGNAFRGDGQLTGIIAILIGGTSWAIGVCISRSVPLPKDPSHSAALTMICGAGFLICASAVTGEFAQLKLSAVTARSAGGLVYLIVFGSLIAFTAYVWLLEHCSPTIVSTHTYVNPIVAVLLGWLMGGETVTGRTLIAGLAILCSVSLIREGAKLGAK